MNAEKSTALPETGYIRQKELVGKGNIIPFSATTLWRKVRAGLFPKPIKLSANCVAWKVEDVRAWMVKQEAASA